jgi:PAS domain S-box-containing protein
MVFKLDANGACFFINDSFLKRFGYTEGDIEGFNWESVIHEDDREDVKKKWQRAIEKKSRFYNEQRVFTQSGEVVNCKVIGYPVLENGHLKEFYGTVDELRPK